MKSLKQILLWMIVYFGGFTAALIDSWIFIIPLILSSVFFNILINYWYKVRK
jgi:hypothetical protein